MDSTSAHLEHGGFSSETAQQPYKSMPPSQSAYQLMHRSAMRDSTSQRQPVVIPFFPNHSSSAASASDDVELRPIDSYSRISPETPPESTRQEADREESQPLSQGQELPRRLHTRWTPFPVKNWVVRPFSILCVCMNAVLVVLLVLSRTRNGLFTINLQHTHVFPLWHFVSTTIANVTALAFSAIGMASLLCQPYIQLQREGGVNVGESLTLDFSRPLPVVAINAIRRRHWVPFFISFAMLLSTSFTPLTASLFSPQDVMVEQLMQLNYTKTLGPSNNINATDAFIQSLLLSSVHGIHEGTVNLPPLTNPTWAVGPMDFIVDPTSSASNVTVPEWYGIQSDPACDYGRVLNTSVTDYNVTITFTDGDGKCIFESPPFPIYYPFGFVNAAFSCDNNTVSTDPVAQGGTLIFARLSPAWLAQNNETAAAVIYCRPSVAAMSIDVTLDSRTQALLSVDNVRPLSSEQQRLYDPTNFTNFLASNAWNGFSIDPAINTNIPPLLIDWLNQWINLTISVCVGRQWLNKSTIQRNGIVMDDPQAYSVDMREYYLSSLIEFYQPYLTLLAAGSYFTDAPTSGSRTAYISGLQTRLIVSTPFCLVLIMALSFSTVLIILTNIFQPRIALPIGTPATMLITAIILGTSPDIVNLGDLRGNSKEELHRALDGYRFSMREGELRVKAEAEARESVEGERDSLEGP